MAVDAPASPPTSPRIQGQSARLVLRSKAKDEKSAASSMDASSFLAVHERSWREAAANTETGPPTKSALTMAMERADSSEESVNISTAFQKKKWMCGLPDAATPITVHTPPPCLTDCHGKPSNGIASWIASPASCAQSRRALESTYARIFKAEKSFVLSPELRRHVES